MYEMHRSERNAIVRNRERDYVGVFVDPEADHNTVIITAAELLDLNPEKCSLVNLNGCKVVDRPIVEGKQKFHWSIGRYLGQTYSKTSSKYKLGLFCEDEDTEVHNVLHKSNTR